MDNSTFWWQAAGVDPGPGPGPDAGDPIGQSLRFRGSSSLSGHTGGSGTASVWIKRGKLGAAQTVMPGIAFDAGDKINSSVALFRDPSAWMHVVINANGTYVNGVSVASGNAISAGTIGASCELYLAAFYFIDGEALLEPTTFGRYNSQGVWVPVDPDGITYGSNGFKLTFEDPSNIGKDYSGNGNDFTATGFEVGNQSSSDYDLMLDSPTQNFATLNPVETPSPAANNARAYTNANLAVQQVFFQGSAYPIATQAFNPATQSVYTEGLFTGASQYGVLLQDINNVTTAPLGIAGLNQPGTIAFHADTVNTRIFSDATEVTGFPVTFSVGDVCRFASSPQGVWIGVNNQWVQNVGGTLTMVNAFPTANPTLPPLSTPPALATITGFAENANCNSFNYGQQPFLYTPPAGFEKLQTQNLPAATIPNGRGHLRAITGPGQGAAAGQANAIVGNWSNQLFSSLGPAGSPDNPDSTTWTPLTNTDAMRFTSRAFDGDATTACRPFGDVNNGWIIFRPDKPIDITAGDLGITGNRLGEIFLNGTDTGFAIDSAAMTTIVIPKNGETELESLWLRGSDVINSVPQLARLTVNGDPLLDLSILNQAQQIFDNGLWWIKDRDNNTGHRLVDSVNANALVQTANNTAYASQAYTAPTGNCVAWCWNAANTNGGFSITNGTHGLGTTPAFVIDRGLNVWHQSLAAGQGLQLFSSNQQAAQTWTVNATTVTGPGGGTYYSWSEIPGYSAFGSYTGNNSADGPFVYTGFRPAFVMVKRSSTTGSWTINDSTRDTANPGGLSLSADVDNPESALDQYTWIDFLSNGFKWRTNQASRNGAGTYIYAAFAENPFGGSNTSPATAR